MLLKYIVRASAFSIYNMSDPHIQSFDTQTSTNRYINHTSYEGVLELAKMAATAYKYDEWVKESGKIPIGWDSDTVRGYVFGDVSDNRNIVIAFKGTSASLFGIGGKTAYNDKLNDNMIFSCCCSKQTSYCPCETPVKKKQVVFRTSWSDQVCPKECMKRTLNYELNYVKLAQRIVEKVMVTLKPKDTTLTGHSLGGAVSAIVAHKLDLKAVAFGAPGELNYAKQVGIVVRDGWKNDKIHHYGHNADPLFTGQCNGLYSSCELNGFKIDTKCHIGRTCLYDTVSRGVGSSIWTHRIDWVIENVIKKWNGELPECNYNKECVDCEKWKYK